MTPIEKNQAESAKKLEASKDLREMDPIFGEKGQTQEQIDARSKTDRLRMLQQDEATVSDIEKKREIRKQINSIRRELNRTAQKNAYMNPRLTRDEEFSKRASELLGEGDIDRVSAKNLLSLERAKRGTLSKFYASRKTLDQQGLETEEPLDITKIKEGDEINIDFGRNSGADTKVGAGDLLPMSIKAVSITDSHGRVRVGIRSVQNGKVGYYDENGYMEIHNGYSMKILTQAETDAALKALGTKVNLSMDESKENEAMDSFLEQADRFPSLAQRLSGANIEQYKSYQEKATALAKKIEDETGIPWQVTYGQATLETGYGRHAPGNNYFGMKGSGQQQTTKEVINGVEVTIQAGFKTYASMEESFADYARLLTANGRYKKAFDHKGDPKSFLQEVIAGGYATDPAYVGKVEAIWGDYDRIRSATPETLATAPDIDPNAKIDRDTLIRHAESYLGMKYKLGADGSNEIDCSQLVVESLKKSGVVSGGFDTTAAGFHSISKPKKANEVERGDLVFLRNGDRITHVEIATGPAVNGVIPILDASGKSNAGKVAYREQPIAANVIVGTPSFYA